VLKKQQVYKLYGIKYSVEVICMKKKNWNRNRTYLRDWNVVNERLVVRGEFLLDLDWVESWSEELCEMNAGKVGRPYEFPESLIKFQGVLGQWIGYRGLEGVARKLVVYTSLPKYDDYSTINRRVNKLNPEIVLPKVGRVNVSCDGSGMKMGCGGEYRTTKYNIRQRKRFLKVIITADPFSKDLLGCEVGMEGDLFSEPEVAMSHLEMLTKAGFDVVKFWGDGSFDVKALFNLLQRYNSLTAIKIRKNASGKADGSLRRAREIEEYMSLGYEKWAKIKCYGRRWTGTEGVFSAVKTIFGEKVRAKTVTGMCREVERRFWAYQRMKIYADSRVSA
jgi:hypothetical protein